MSLAHAEIDLEFPEVNYELPEENCAHCGGIMRYYMGSVSCLLCGRDHTHHCQRCVYPNHESPTAPQTLTAQVNPFTDMDSREQADMRTASPMQEHDNAAA